MRCLPYYVDTEVQFLITASFSFLSKNMLCPHLTPNIFNSQSIWCRGGFVGDFFREWKKHHRNTLSVSFYFLRNPFRTLAIWTRFFFRFYHKRWQCIGDGTLQKQVHGGDKNWRLKTEQKGKKHERREGEKKVPVCYCFSTMDSAFINTLLHTREISKACSGRFLSFFLFQDEQTAIR